MESEGNPRFSSSERIGSNASWRMNASIFFMPSPHAVTGARRRLRPVAASDGTGAAAGE